MRPLNAKFICSYPGIDACPAEELPEFAFVGRSNVGKSSMINMLTTRHGIARVSEVPGKTRMINHFLIDDSWYLVDLPGYGYAQVSQTGRKKMQQVLDGYLFNRKHLRMVFLLIDSRLTPQRNDLNFIARMTGHQIPFVILYTKTDKLSNTELQKSLRNYQRILQKTNEILPVIIPTSVKTKAGKEIVLGIISELLEGNNL